MQGRNLSGPPLRGGFLLCFAGPERPRTQVPEVRASFKPNDEKCERPTKTPGDACTHCKTSVCASRTSVEFVCKCESETIMGRVRFIDTNAKVCSLPPPISGHQGRLEKCKEYSLESVSPPSPVRFSTLNAVDRPDIAIFSCSTCAESAIRPLNAD